MLKINLQLFGVDWISCDNCGKTFPDCGEFVYCTCGTYWCCDECAKEDGYQTKDCEKWDYDKDDDENQKICKTCEIVDCNWDGEVTSCKYCRNEDFDNNTLLDFLLSKLDKSREEVINEYKRYINKK